MTEYISRDTAIARLTKLEVTDKLATMADAKREIADMPAADVAPVVRGRWIGSKEHIYLTDSVCKEWINFYCSECDVPNNSPTDFCPSCGARMDGKDGDDNAVD